MCSRRCAQQCGLHAVSVFLTAALALTGCPGGKGSEPANVNLVAWPGARPPHPNAGAFPDWAYRMKLWPFDILEPDMTPLEIEERLEAALDEDADTVIFYIESEHMFGTFVDEAGFTGVLGQVEHLTDEAAARGLRTIVYLNGLEVMTRGAFDQNCEPTGVPTMASEHSDWLQRDMDGQPIVFECQDSDWLEPDWEDAWVSPFSGYRELFRSRILSLAQAGVDGVYIDATFLPGFQDDWDNLRWGSSDPLFAEAFSDATGLSIPATVDLDDPDFRRFVDFRHEAVAGYLGDLASTARAQGLAAFWESSTNDTVESTVLANETAVTGRQGMGFSPEIEPEGDWLAAFRMAKAARELNAERPVIYLGWPESRRAARNEYAIALCHSGTYYPTADIDVPDEAFAFQDEIAPILDERSHWNGGVALIYSVRNKDFTFDNDGFFDVYVEAFEALVRHHVPFSIATLEYLEQDGLDGVTTLVLPSVRAISNAEAALMEGKQIVVLGDDPGTHDETGAPRASPLGLEPDLELEDVPASLPFYLAAPAGTWIEYYGDAAGGSTMYLFAVSPDPGGAITITAGPGSQLDVVWTCRGCAPQSESGPEVEVGIESELMVITISEAG